MKKSILLNSGWQSTNDIYLQKDNGIHKGVHMLQNTAIINVPIIKVWDEINDSMGMLNWAPPVTGVEVYLLDGQTTEQLGSKRKVIVDYGKNSTGYFIEQRIIHTEGINMGYEIFEETIGMSKVAKEPSFQINLEKITETQTKLIFNVYLSPKGLMGYLMRGTVIKMFNKSNQGAIANMKIYLETGKKHK